ncbi:MAG: hypothetical protein FJZ01_01845 [Candidatus Sericytochromatia bacterium]|nr:hypothetical protein [Candidatus Tanganyikabacteria bacterium]
MVEAEKKVPAAAEQSEQVAPVVPSLRGPAWLKPALTAIFLIALAVTLALGWRFWAKDAAFQKDLQTRAEASARKGAAAFEEIVSRIEAEARELAEAGGPATRDGLAGLLAADPALTSVGYVPPTDVADAEKRPAVMHIRRPAGNTEQVAGESRRAAGEGWVEPYYRQEIKERVAEYSVPVKGGGVLFVDFGTSAIDRVIDSIDLGSAGFAFMVSAEKGRVLTYPVSEYVIQKQSLDALSTRIQEPAYARLAKAVKAGDAGTFSAVSGRTGSPYWLSFQRVKQTGWSYVVRLSADKPSAAALAGKQNLIQICIAFLVMAIAGLALFFQIDGFEDNELWRLCGIWAIGLIGGTLFIWLLALGTVALVQSDSDIMLTDRGQLQRFISQDPYANGKLTFQTPIRVSTGMHVQSVEFSGTNNVSVTGIVWQQVPDAIKDKFVPGVTFPEAISASLGEAYTRPAINGTTLGWNYKITLRQDFDYSRYPLDHQNIWIRLRPAEFDKNIMLVPDLDSYGTWDLADLPGIDVSAVLSGWFFEQTFFDYTKLRYKSNFGIQSYVGQSDFPELRYNMLIARNFAGPMISVILPICIIAGLLFLNLKFTKPGDKTMAVLGPIVGFFFSVALTHAKVRDTFSSGDFIFMEVFCLEMYLMIGFVALAAILKASEIGPKLFHARGGLYSQLVYWPLLSTLLFASTIAVFYR